MRANLKARGYSGIDNADPDTYDDNIVAVVEHFQRRQRARRRRRRRTEDDRRHERHRRRSASGRSSSTWSAGAGCRTQLGSRHVFVNQAGFEMFLVDKGKVVARHKVIVGKPFHQTPMFSDKIAYAEFNPTWTVTPAIAAAEFLPKLREDPGYLAAQRLRALWRLGRRRAGHRPVVGELGRGEQQEIPLPHRAAAGSEERARRRQVHVPEQVQHLPARHAVAAAVRRRPAAPSAMAASACTSR